MNYKNGWYSEGPFGIWKNPNGDIIFNQEPGYLLVSSNKSTELFETLDEAMGLPEEEYECEFECEFNRPYRIITADTNRELDAKIQCLEGWSKQERYLGVNDKGNRV